LDDSILCLQASQKRENTDIQLRRFYLKLGFSCHDEFKDDNGLSQTSEGFQKAVQKFSQLWVFPERKSMSFFWLCKGWLIFLPWRELDVCKSAVSDSVDTYVYARFPWPCHSMKRIEEYFDTRPILSSLSDQALPISDRPLTMKRSESTMVGRIVGPKCKTMNSTSWLCTDEVQFLFAILLRNQMSNKCFHVFNPTITQSVADLYEVFRQNCCGQATEQEKQQYEFAID
jgi:hypothetical protein